MELSEEYKKAHGLTPELVADTLIAFYQKVDEATEKIQENLKNQGICLNCKPGCCHCCQDDLTMTPAEAAVIKKLFPDLKHQKPHAKGLCPFLDDQGLCRIYEARPYICRTHGLPLRWISEDGNEQRDICEINESCADILTLPQESCWNSDTAEMQLSLINLCTYGDYARVSMRDFFIDSPDNEKADSLRHGVVH